MTTLMVNGEVPFNLYLDDERTPKTDMGWVIVRDMDSAIEAMIQNGCPLYMSFYHDLGDGPSGYDVAKWMVERDMDMSGGFMPSDFQFNVHSANPVGSANIRKYMESYIEFREK